MPSINCLPDYLTLPTSEEVSLPGSWQVVRFVADQQWSAMSGVMPDSERIARSHARTLPTPVCEVCKADLPDNSFMELTDLGIPRWLCAACQWG